MKEDIPKGAQATLFKGKEKKGKTMKQ